MNEIDLLRKKPDVVANFDLPMQFFVKSINFTKKTADEILYSKNISANIASSHVHGEARTS